MNNSGVLLYSGVIFFDVELFASLFCRAIDIERALATNVLRA